MSNRRSARAVVATILLGAVLLVLVAGWLLRAGGPLALAVDPSIRSLLPTSGDDLAYFEDVRDRFQSDDALFLVLTDEQLFTPAHLATLKTLAQRVRSMPQVTHVESLATALRTVVHADYSEVSAYLATVPADNASAAALRAAVLTDPLVAGYLVSGDGRGAVIAIRLRAGLDSPQRIAAVAAIARAADEAAPDLSHFLSGPLYARIEISRLLYADLARTLPLAVLASLVVAALGFRHLHALAWPLLANAAALAVTMLLFAATGQQLNYVTVMLPPTVYVVGFAYAIHVVSDIDRHAAAGMSAADAARTALAELRRPLMLTALTTACGFLALSASGIPSIQTFGRFAALGTALAWLASLIVVPAGLRLRRRAPRRTVRGDFAAAWLAACGERWRRPLVAGAVLVAVVSVAGIMRVGVDTDYLRNFDRDSAPRTQFDELNRRFAGAVPLQIVLEAGAVDAFKQPAALRELHALQNWLSAQPEIGGVYSLVDYVAELERVLAPDLIDTDPVPADAALVSHLVLLGATEDMNRFVDRGFSSSLLQVRVRSAASAELNALVARIEARLSGLPAGLAGRVTGSSRLIAQTVDDVTRGQVLSLCAALLPILAVMIYLFRSVSRAFVALVPNVLPLLVFFALLGFAGLPLSLTTSLVAAVVLGIAVDDSVHFFARLERARDAAGDPRAAVTATLTAVIRPVTLTTAGLVLGFLVLNVAELRSQGEFGALAALTLACAWLLDLCLSPALAYVSGMARGTPAAQQRS